MRSKNTTIINAFLAYEKHHNSPNIEQSLFDTNTDINQWLSGGFSKLNKEINAKVGEPTTAIMINKK